MKQLLFFAALLFKLAAFELFLNSGVEAGKNISILHIRNHEPFSCRFITTEDLKEFYKCELRGKSKLISDQHVNYFDMEFKNHDDQLEIFIYPKTNSRLVNSDQVLYEKTNVRVNKSQISTDFFIEFYPDVKEPSTPNGLDFEVGFKDLLHPSIGALDLDQNPVDISDNNDISMYLSAKRALSKHEYEQLFDMSNIAIRDYPSSIFASEFYLFRIEALYGMLDSNTQHAVEIINDGKDYIRRFPSSPNYPHILQMVVHAYLRMQQRGDAEYFIDILNSEQPDDYYTKLANLDYADYLVVHKKKHLATKLYNNILFGTQDAELASKAAIALAKINISNDQLAEAQEFVIKVLDANRAFLRENRSKTISIADDFYHHKMYETAAKLYELALEDANTNESFYERVEKNLTLCLVQLRRFDEAANWLERYRKDFPVGEYNTLMDEVADELYFEQPEKDHFKLHEYYRLLMAKYDNHIAARALAEETKLLFSEKNYEEIYALKDKITASEDENLQNIFKSSIKDLLVASLHQDNCSAALRYLNELSLEEIAPFAQKPKLLDCLHRLGDYVKEREILERYYDIDPVGADLRLARIDELSNRRSAIIERLYKTLQNPRKKSKSEMVEIYRYLALNELELDHYNEAINALQQLEKYSPRNMELVEVYAKFLGYFKLHNLNISAINYGTKAIDIQNQLGINQYSPELELITIEALQERGMYQKVLEVLTDFTKVNMPEEDRTRALYMEAQAAKRLGRTQQAIDALKRCSAGKWLELCQADLATLQPPEPPKKEDEDEEEGE